MRRWLVRMQIPDVESDQSKNEKQNQQLHCFPVTFSSFPVTTPDATRMRALPSTGICTRAIPRFTGASTVVLPVLSVLVKLTTVPSGTGLPLQSRIGSVAT